MKLLETIRYKDGVFNNLDLHESRMNESRKILLHSNTDIDLHSELNKSNVNLAKDALYKCRVNYEDIITHVEFIPYALPEIGSLKQVICDDIDYNFKYLNRNKIDELFNLRGKADDIVIVKNGLITDSSYANLLFFNGKRWVTPSYPLLRGTQRAVLLKQEKVITANIRPSDLSNFEKVRLINAMIRFEDEVDVVIENIF